MTRKGLIVRGVDQQYIVRGVARDTGEYLFWSNTHGWTDLVSEREYFSREERYFLHLPVACDMVTEIKWVPVF